MNNIYEPPSSDLVEGQISSDQVLASRGIRLVASIIDSLIMAVIIVPVMFATGYFESAMSGSSFELQLIVLPIIIGIAAFLLVNGYFLHTQGQTVAKKMFGIRIVRYHDGEIIPLWEIIIKRFAPMAILGNLPIIGGLFGLLNAVLIFGQEKRCLHDYIAGTKVVNVS